MSLFLKKSPGSPWTMRLMLPGLGLALGFRGARTELVKIHQERESNAEHLGAERITEMEEQDEDVPSDEGDAGDVGSGDDEVDDEDGSEDGSEGGEEEDGEEEDGEDEDGYEQHDQEGAKNNDDLENRGKLQPVSALTIIVPSQEVIEVMRCTIDEETLKGFVDMPTAGKLKTLAALALAVTARVAVIGFILWGMAQASENNIVLVFYR